MVNDHLKGVGCVVLAICFGSPLAVLTRMLEHSNVWTQLVCRTVPYSLVALCATLYLFGSPRRMARKFRRIGLFGALASIALAAQDTAICAAFLLTTAGNVAAIINTSPVFCAVSDRFVLREPVPWRTVLMVALGMVGLAVIFAGDASAERRYMTGNLVALVNPLSWTVYWAIIRAAAKREAKAKEQGSEQRRQQQQRQQQQQEVVQVTDEGEQEEDAKKQMQGKGNGKGKAKEGGDEEDEEGQWWEKLLVYQVSAVLLAALAGLCAGFQPETVELPRDAGLYSIYGAVSLPVCLLLFSLAPRYASTAEVGCAKTLEIAAVPVAMYAYNREVPSRSTFVGGALILAAVAGHSVAVIVQERQEQQGEQEEEWQQQKQELQQQEEQERQEQLGKEEQRGVEQKQKLHMSLGERGREQSLSTPVKTAAVETALFNSE